MVEIRCDLDDLRLIKVGSDEVSVFGGCSTATQVRRSFFGSERWIWILEGSIRSDPIMVMGLNIVKMVAGSFGGEICNLWALIGRSDCYLLNQRNVDLIDSHLEGTISIFLWLFIEDLLGKIVQDFLNLVMEGLRGITQGQWLSKSEGKKVVAAKPSLKITVPRFDNSEIIASYGKTLIGRCMNPQKQDMKILLFMMPKIWQVEGRVAGTDLGLGRFQFDFDMEEDITEVLKMEPFHFDYWMVSLVRWKPVLEANYPSSIIFWVRVLDMPLQFRAAQTLHSVGQAIGRVLGEVDVLGGRVRVEVDGFKPLIFTMAIEFEEGVEVTVSLRYEKLFGYCRECFRMTHDKTRCPSLHQEITREEGVMEGNAVFGATATSYKAAVANISEPVGERIDGERNGGKPAQFQSSRDGNKGKGIIREKPGPYRQEGSYHAYRERLPRGNGEGSSFRGRQYGYPGRRYGGQYQGVQRSRNDAGEGRLHVDNPEKLMLDAFKGLNRSSNEGDKKKGNMVESETVSKARKALLFDESSGVDDNKESDGVVVKALSKETGVIEGVQVQRDPEGVMTDATHLEDKEAYQALDEANLMVEGVILSDSELMVDDEFDDTQEWEEGEIELMEEEVDAEQEVAVDEQGETDPVKGEEDLEKGKQAKKKMTRPGALALGVSTKSRLVQNLISLKKKVSTKAPAKGGGKGSGPSKKESTKP
ncbi:hypothetical protein Bca4012_019324 [Brassica carinata]